MKCCLEGSGWTSGQVLSCLQLPCLTCSPAEQARLQCMLTDTVLLQLCLHLSLLMWRMLGTTARWHNGGHAHSLAEGKFASYQ